MVLSIISGIGLLIPSIANYAWFVFFVVPVYFVAGMKRFYQQGIVKILLKSFILFMTKREGGTYCPAWNPMEGSRAIIAVPKDGNL